MCVGESILLSVSLGLFVGDRSGLYMTVFPCNPIPVNTVSFLSVQILLYTCHVECSLKPIVTST